MTENLRNIYNKKIQNYQENSKDLFNDLELNFKFLSKSSDSYNPYSINYDNILKYTSGNTDDKTYQDLDALKSKCKVLVEKLNIEYNTLLNNYKGTNTSVFDNVNKLNKNYVQLADIFAIYYLLKLYVVLYIHIQTRIIVLKSNQLNLSKNSCTVSDNLLKSKQEEINQLNKLLEEFKNKNQELSQQLFQKNSNLKNTAEKYNVSIKNLENDKINLMNQIKEKEQELLNKKNEFNTNSSSKNTKISNLASELNNLNKELFDIRNKLKNKEDEFLKYSQNSASNISKREQEFENLKNNLLKSQSDNENLLKENENLKKQNNDLKNFLNDILPLLSNFALNNNT